MMQVEGMLFDRPAGLGGFFQRKIEKGTVVGLEFHFSVRFQDLVVSLQKNTGGQASFVVPGFRPWIGKIQIDSVDFVFSEDLSGPSP